MKKIYKLTLAVALLIAGIFSANAQEPDVYVGGTQNDQAAIWKNGTPQLYDGFEIYSIVETNGDFYVAGLNKQNVPVIWKNEEILYTLNEYPFIGSSVTSMTIHEGDVYATTTELTENGLVGRLWINGVASEDYSGATELYTVCFDGDDMYVAGGIIGSAVLWKNAEPLYTYSSTVTALFVDATVVDGDVYYIGGDFGAAGKNAPITNKANANANQNINKDFSFNIWKNGEIIYTIGNEVYGAKLEVANGNVYACGQAPGAGAFNAKVWINGEGTILSDIWSGAQDLCVYNDDVYVTGFMGEYPELDTFIWKNGELNALTSPGYDMGNCIIVVGEGEDVEEINDLSNIYPNPANSYISIEGVEFEKATLTNSLGQIVLTTDNNMIDVSSLEAGLYLLKLDNNITRKIIIKH